ncbi:MAG: hypothetical protein ACR5K9_02695 [Wolbachia sp.]
MVNVKFCVEECNVFDDYGKPVSSTGMTREGLLGLQCNLVIPARDAGIQEFYQVGKHKSYVKMYHFYGKAGSQCQALG